MKAVCLLSGGLDSAVCLYSALKEGHQCTALSFDYGQRHTKEIAAAAEIVRTLGIAHHVLNISLPWGGSALTDRKMKIPAGRSEKEMAAGIPDTYVPARNSIFLTYALSLAEAEGSDFVYIGANAVDYSGYPDCRPEYFNAMQKLFDLATKVGTEGRKITIKTPLLHLSKKEIVILGAGLGVPFEKTWSCYQGGEFACGLCDSCLLRAKGFREANVRDTAMTAAVRR
ncbi:MAG: 7-cyano-7-deazaguanine synthase QueC [Omnitrophica bacterium GWA2_52_8]|nr:MAG: 7-cyano-7-deazaguanine synthase QueC [Omnitrophica bacterium GWA2_52_8]